MYLLSIKETCPNISFVSAYRKLNVSGIKYKKVVLFGFVCFFCLFDCPGSLLPSFHKRAFFPPRMAFPPPDVINHLIVQPRPDVIAISLSNPPFQTSPRKIDSVAHSPAWLIVLEFLWASK